MSHLRHQLVAPPSRHAGLVSCARSREENPIGILSFGPVTTPQSSSQVGSVRIFRNFSVKLSGLFLAIKFVSSPCFLTLISFIPVDHHPYSIPRSKVWFFDVSGKLCRFVQNLKVWAQFVNFTN